MTHNDSSRVWNRGLAALGLAALSVLPACGSRTSGGNTGSETHWLQSCDTDAECGAYSCLCGVCSRSCSDGVDCEGGSTPGRCSDEGELSCPSQTPAQICVKLASRAGGICDGSDDFRWGFLTAASGFFATREYLYATYYGAQFLAIDGKCNFWGSTTGSGLVFGKVTDPKLLEVYESALYGKLERFGDAPPLIPDAEISVVWDPSGTIYGYPDDGVEGPDAEYYGALAQAKQLADALVAIGQPVSDGPLRALLMPLEDGASETAPWPLDLDPTTVIRGIANWDGGSFNPYTGALFEAGPRADALRAALVSGNLFHYSGAEEADFSIAVRSEPPTRVGAFVQFIGENAWGGSDACIGSQDDSRLCKSNEDCCGTSVCCVDCGENSGKCIADSDPCSTCLASGSRWVDFRTCDTNACVPDSSCYSECPGACAEGNCGGCGRSDDCWAAGCEWQEADESAYCISKSEVVQPPDEPCSIDATSVDLPGATVHLEADSCSFVFAQGGQFRYTVDLNQSIDFTSESSGGGCGLCGVATDPETWVSFVIEGSDASYCPECNVGCCPPTEAVPVTLDVQSTEGTVDWPGLTWSGPSDTGNLPGDPFAPGSYEAKVTLRLPRLGEVVAVLPIEVIEAP